MQPWLDVEVSDAEYTDLYRAGVLVPDSGKTSTGGKADRDVIEGNGQ
jgi:hypothetical protein